VGALPTNVAADGKIKDPLTKYFLKIAAHPQVPLLDSIVPLKVAPAVLPAAPGRVLGQGHDPLKAMQNVDSGLKTLNP